MVRVFSRLFPALLAAFMLVTSAAAQTLPDFNDPMINDWANRIDDNDARSIAQKINKMSALTGAELVLVTMNGREDYGWATPEAFSQALFDKWANTDIRRQRGILFFINFGAPNEAKIALGAGYPATDKNIATRIIRGPLSRHFSERRYDLGLFRAIEAVDEQIARPSFAPVISPFAFKTFLKGYIGYFISVGAVLFVLFYRRRRQIFIRLRRCPDCRHRSLRMQRKTIVPAMELTDGYGEERIICKSCDFYRFGKYMIVRRNPNGIAGRGLGTGGVFHGLFGDIEGGRGSYTGDTENKEFGPDGRPEFGSHKQKIDEFQRGRRPKG